MVCNRKAIIRSMAEWQRAQEYTHFATATFKYGSNLSEDHVRKTLRYFFNSIDRRLYKHKGTISGKRFERMVYLERGRGRDNLHTHFFYKAETELQATNIAHIATDIWLNKIYKSESIYVLPNSKNDNRDAYAMKEYYFPDDDNYIPELSVINTPR